MSTLWYNPLWAYRKQITINSGSISGSLTNFPMLVSASNDINLSASAQSNGNDILFTSTDGVTKLSHEIETYQTGNLIAWVNVPAVTSVSNTSIYMYYGNLAAGNQADSSSVWDSNYFRVWHLNNTASVPDSTITASNGTPSGFLTTDIVNGQIYKGLNFHGGQRITISITGLTNFTVEYWVNFTTTIDGNQIPIGTNGTAAIEYNGTKGRYNDGSNDLLIANYSSSQAVWEHWVWTRSSATTAFKVYVNGSWNNQATPSFTFAPTRLGSSGVFSPGLILDELRISNIPRSDAYIKTIYNNQASSSLFSTFGNQEIYQSGFLIGAKSVIGVKTIIFQS